MDKQTVKGYVLRNSAGEYMYWNADIEDYEYTTDLLSAKLFDRDSAVIVQQHEARYNRIVVLVRVKLSTLE